MAVSPRDDAIALGIATGKSAAEMAKSAGVSERTVRRHLRDPAVLALAAEYRGRVVGQTVGLLAAAGTDAVRELRKLLKADSEAVRLGASRGIIDSLVRLGSYSELSDRLAAIESRLATAPAPLPWENR